MKTSHEMRTSTAGQQGMTLVEVAMAVAVIGVLMGGALELNQRAQTQQHFETTYDNMDQIIQALSVYVETAGRLPCPADPAATGILSGWERGVTPADLQVDAGHFPAGHCDQKTREGIIPFMTLGLPARTALDGWGRYYTYAVSPVFARRNDQAAEPADTGKIHGRCRHPGWVNPADHYNRNAVKARFCCADQLSPVFDMDSDLMIFHTAGGSLSPVRTQGTMNNYDNLDRTTTIYAGNSQVPSIDTTPIEAPALVLVSHGPDGKGAWVGNGSDKRFDPPEGLLQLQNADGNQVFVDGPWNLVPGPNYFDDIVRWMTQDGIIAAHGALSCQYP
jgi:prepilin-type N-terminal cleavage/methylation domain-containing protein